MPIVFDSHRTKPWLAVGGRGVLFIYNWVSRVVEKELNVEGPLVHAILHENYVAAVSDRKRVYCWRVEANGDCMDKVTRVGEYLMPKRLTSVSIVPNTDHALVSDKAGDLWRLKLETDGPDVVTIEDVEGGTNEPILGHFSVLTDFDVAERAVATADRDNKIRISRLPEAFVIDAFLLGHRESIAQVKFVSSSLLVSSSLDGTVRLWDRNSMDQIDEIELEGEEIATGMYVQAGSLGMICHAQRYLLYSASVSVENKLSGIVRLPLSAEPTGLAIDCRSRLWVSANDDNGDLVVNVFSRDGAEPSRSLEDEQALQRALAGRGVAGEPDALIKGDVLLAQKKKPMVDNWKGKKRKVDSTMTRLLR